MTAARVEFDAREWTDFLKKSEANLRDPARVLMAAAEAFLFQDIDQHFRSEEGPGGSWAQRKEPYRSRIERAGYRKILQVTGNLRGSIMPGNMVRASKDSVRVFANAPYSGYLDEGTPVMRGRPFMWASSIAQDKMIDLVLEIAAGNVDV